MIKKLLRKGGVLALVDRIGLLDIAVTLVLIALCVVFLFPLVYTISISLSDASHVYAGEVNIIPVGFTLKSYEFVLQYPDLRRAYFNSVLYAGLGTIISVLLTSMTAYPLSIRTFAFRKPVTIFFIITMYFTGGLIPYYMTIRYLGMINTLSVMVVPGAINVFYLIIYRTFFQEISPSLRESAFMDGANDLQILFRIVLPLSKPLIATMVLYCVVGMWNDYFNAMIFLNSAKKYPLQILLRTIIVQMEFDQQFRLYRQFFAGRINAKTVRSAMVVVVMFPIMAIYPFLQRYFVKGIMIGAVKG